MTIKNPRWRLAKKILTGLFFIAVAVLLVVYAQKVDWAEVWKVIRNYDRVSLLSAVALVVVSFLIYGCYDLLGRIYCGHKLAKRQVMLVSFICYAFNLTLSTWVGGIGMRYRLYSTGPAQRHHHPHLLSEHHHELAGLYFARRGNF